MEPDTPPPGWAWKASWQKGKGAKGKGKGKKGKSGTGEGKGTPAPGSVPSELLRPGVCRLCYEEGHWGNQCPWYYQNGEPKARTGESKTRTGVGGADGDRDGFVEVKREPSI